MDQLENGFVRRPAPRAESRHSVMSSISRLWKATIAPSDNAASPIPGKTFVVPLLLSTSRSSARNNLYGRGALPNNTRPTITRSRTSTRSIIENSVPHREGLQPLSVPAELETEGSDLYGAASVSNVDSDANLATSESQNTHPISQNSTRSSRTRNSRNREQERASSKRSFRDPAVNAKLRISIAFGITLITTLVIYTVLAATGTANDALFHALSILLIIALTGVFLHQVIRMLMLRHRPRRTRRRKPHQRHRHHIGDARAYRSRAEGGLEDEIVPEKPIQVTMVADDQFAQDVEMSGAQGPIQHPPPIYGNYRNSVRMNPDFVHWRHVPPTPLTPTYDEALTSVQQEVGYRPPSYLSQGGVSELVAQQGRDVDEALESIHPLERERMRTLAADALEGRNQI